MKGFGNNNQFKKRKINNLNKENDNYQILNQAIKFQSEGNIVQAIKYYEFLIAKGIQESVVFSNYGIILINSGRLKEALFSIRKAIELNPNDDKLHSNLGGILKDLGKLKEAELSIRKAIELNPKDAILHTNLGGIFKDLGKLKEAELSIRKAIEFHPDFVNAYYNLGIILSDLGRLEEAEVAYRKATELKPDYTDAYLNLGIILSDLGKLKEAEYSIRKAIELNPDFAVAHCNLGGILSDLGKLEEAELSTRKAIELNPDYTIANLNLGNILKDLGKLEEAELSTRKAIELNPDFVIAHSNLGGILNDLGKLEEAELSTRKAIELDPDYADAYLNLGGILNDLGKSEEAEYSIRKAIELNPHCALANTNLGSILSELGKYEEAEKSLLQAIKINPNFGRAYFFLSILKVSSEQKNWEKYLFSKNILTNQKKINLIDIYFAQANILEQKFNYIHSSKMFMKANTLNRKIYGSNYIRVKNQMRYFYERWQQIKSKQVRKKNQLTSIFIVGLPRSGKTITESILSCNNSLLKCGENNALSKAVDKYLNSKNLTKNQDLHQLYIESISREISNKLYTCSTTPENYKFTGIIASQIINSKVIYCFRHPLDHIKEIFCCNLANKFTFKTSIVELAKILLSINELMENYKKVYNSKIYFLNYDKLVFNPENEIKSLLSWLGIEYKDEYLYPKLDTTTTIYSDKKDSVLNTKHLNVWKDYKKLLQPAIDIITSSKNLTI